MSTKVISFSEKFAIIIRKILISFWDFLIYHQPTRGQKRRNRRYISAFRCFHPNQAKTAHIGYHRVAQHGDDRQ